MGYDGWVKFNDTELINLSRTAQLAESMGLDMVWTSPESVAWIETAVGGADYTNVANAPWYDPQVPASAEFAGVVSLGMPGLDDSSLEASVTEYITDGGKSGRSRNATKSIVVSAAIVASTDRGASYGKRWLDKILRGSGSITFCTGAELRYFQYQGDDAPQVHRRDVKCTRGASVTRKRITDCSSTWLITFTLTDSDSYEYGDPVSVITELGGVAAVGPAVADDGTVVLMQESCPVYDYSPVFDPLYPALVPSPTAPDFYPEGWSVEDGDAFQRFWAKIDPVEPSLLNVIPVFTLTTTVDARMVRVSIWPSDSDVTDQCDPLFSAVVFYLPSDVDFIIDSEQQASYTWDGGAAVRRADSLVYAPDAKPVQWTAFNDTGQLLVTLDVFTEGSGYEGDGEVRAALELIPKSD